jgi:hypothetical protein
MLLIAGYLNLRHFLCIVNDMAFDARHVNGKEKTNLSRWNERNSSIEILVKPG